MTLLFKAGYQVKPLQQLRLREAEINEYKIHWAACNCQCLFMNANTLNA